MSQRGGAAPLACAQRRRLATTIDNGRLVDVHRTRGESTELAQAFESCLRKLDVALDADLLAQPDLDRHDRTARWKCRD